MVTAVRSRVEEIETKDTISMTGNLDIVSVELQVYGRFIIDDLIRLNRLFRHRG